MPAELGPRLALALVLLTGRAAGDVAATAPAAPSAPQPAPAKPVAKARPALDAGLAEFLGEFSDDEGVFVDPFALDAVDAKAPPGKPITKDERATTPAATAVATPPQEKDHGH